MARKSSFSRGFTLIELLVVIAIIAILAVVVVLTLNPAEMMREARDSNRLSDLATLQSAINLYNTDAAVGAASGTLGNPNIVYVSLPDQTLTGSQTSTCSSLNLPSLPTGYTYQCVSPAASRSTNGQGWLPVNLSSLSAGSPISSLPVDPTNQSSTGLYYTFSPQGSSYLVTAIPEGQKQKTALAANPEIPNYPDVMAAGTSLTASPLWNPQGLVGYWPLNEGSGTIAYDQSGNGNNGTWSGSTPYYTTGKFGLSAGNFNGSNNSITSNNSLSWGPNGSIGLWMDPSAAQISTSTWTAFVFLGNYESGLIIRGTDHAPYVQFESSGNGVAAVGNPLVANLWVYIVATWSYYNSGSSTISFYQNGNLMASTIGPSPNIVNPLFISPNPFSGSMNVVRVYNRALSPAEVMALYNAEK